MNRFIVGVFALGSFLLGCKMNNPKYVGSEMPSFEDPVIVVSWIDSVGVNVALQDLLLEDNKTQLAKVLSGIQTGDEHWLMVLSKLRPTLMASAPAIQFDLATSEALEKNPAGVLKSAATINREWNRLAKISEGDIHYPFNICGSYPDEWNEEISAEQRSLRAIPFLKKRQEIVANVNSSDVSDPIKDKCLEAITSALDLFNVKKG